MKYISTRGNSPKVTFREAIFAGLASDGGLYVPEKFPACDYKQFPAGCSLIEVGARVFAAFADEPEFKGHFSEICGRAFNFPITLEPLDGSTWILDLFHGPTAAFKDVGARFLAECIALAGAGEPRTILVATSGDTGGAVAGAFFGKPGIEVVILFPKGMVSEFQEMQLTSWGGNVSAFRVRGTFDDCQRMVKEAFLDPQWKTKHLVSANSINIGRILPQSMYYAWASLDYLRRTGRKPGFIIPSGNLGNALAGLWAKRMGFPIGKIALACNANRAVVDFFETGQWHPQETKSTLANAMDVGSASNMERLRHLYPDMESLWKDALAFSVNDEEIRAALPEAQKRWNRVLCPHTATAAFVRNQLPGSDWIIVATAHAAKFRSVVEPLIDGLIVTPPALGLIEKRKVLCKEIDPALQNLAQALL